MEEGTKGTNPLAKAMRQEPLAEAKRRIADLIATRLENGNPAFEPPVHRKNPEAPGRDWFPEPDWMSGGDAFELLRLQCKPCEYAPAEARLCQIIADQFDRETAGLNYVIDCLPPSHQLLNDFPVGTPCWFRALHGLLTVKDAEEIDGWENLVSDLYEWAAMNDSLRLRAGDVLDNALSHHWSIEAYSLPETKQDPIWNFPKAMAWIATRDFISMARLSVFTRPSFEHDDAVVEDGVWGYATKSLGWLHSAISLAYCECGAVQEFRLRSFKHCTCISVAWEELVHFNGGLSAATPELVFGLQEGWISMTWPDGADDIRFLRRDIMERWPPNPQSNAQRAEPNVSTAKAEENCRAWLEEQFATDPAKRRSKSDFRTDALAAFAGRLTERGFNLRVWPELARKHGRDSAGAKRKS